MMHESINDEPRNEQSSHKTVRSRHFNLCLIQMEIIYFDFTIRNRTIMAFSTRFIKPSSSDEKKIKCAIVHHVQFSLVIVSDTIRFLLLLLLLNTHIAVRPSTNRKSYTDYSIAAEKKCLIYILVVVDREECSDDKFIVLHCCCLGSFVLFCLTLVCSIRNTLTHYG